MTRLVLLAFLLSVQDQQPDLCELSGSVVNSVTGEPLNHVELFADQLEGGPAARTATDAKGNFTLIDLKPGRYRLRGTRNGYLDMYYGARRPDSKGTPITLVPGQRMKDVKFKMMPFAVIAGTVRESDGEPITGAYITLLRLYHHAEGPALERSANAETDDLGQFRITDLVPGKYFARASPSLSSPDENGEDHGGKDTPRETLVGVTYGGSQDLAGARPIEVGPGARITGIDFTLPRSRIFHVRGHATAPTGTDFRVWLTSGRVNDRVGDSFNGVLNKETGDFDIPGVPAGAYTLYADARKRKAEQASDGRLYIDLYQPLRATLPVEVAGRDVDGLRIVVEDGAEIAGHLAVVDQDSVPITGARVYFHGVYENYPAAYVKPDRTFSVTLAPGHYEVLFEDGNGYKRVIRSIQSAEVDVLRVGLDVHGPGSVPLEIVLAPDAADLDGTALDKDNNPAPGATIVAIPEPVFRRRSDRFFTAAADQQGRFQIKGMPPGDYQRFAWDDVEPDAWFDPEFVRTIESRGQSVKIEAKGAASVKLRLIQ